jgi:predicted ATPase
MTVKGEAAPETERAYTRARVLCEQAGDPPELFPALWGLWLMHLLRGELRTAYELAERLMWRAQSAHDPALLQHAHTSLGDTFFWMGLLLPAREHFEMAISLYDPERHRALAFRFGTVDNGIICLSYTAGTLWRLGYPDQAVKRENEALAFAHGLSHPLSLAFTEFFVAILRQSRREARAAQAAAEGVIALCVKHGFPGWLAMATSVRGWAMAEQGCNEEEGIAQIEEGLAAARTTGAGLWRPHLLCLLAEAYGKADRLDGGLRALAEALAAAEENENRVYESEIHRLKGELLFRRGDSNAAEAQNYFERAIEIARMQSAKSLELRATMSLARLLDKQDNRDEARAMLAEIYGWFTEGFDTADLKDAKALLDELSA